MELPAAWSDALLPKFANSSQGVRDGAQIQVGDAFETNVALASLHLPQLRQVNLHDVTLADIKRHVILLRGQGAKLAERR